MTTRNTSQDRAVRIELLRARAAIERQSMVHGLQHLGASLTPRGLLNSFMPGGSRPSASSMLMQALTLSKQYPMVMSLGSALLSSVARRRLRWIKLAGGAVLAWQIASHALRR